MTRPLCHSCQPCSHVLKKKAAYSAASLFVGSVDRAILRSTIFSQSLMSVTISAVKGTGQLIVTSPQSSENTSCLMARPPSACCRSRGLRNAGGITGGGGASPTSEAIRYYSDEQTFIDTLAALRWPDGEVSCTGCGEIDNTIWLANQKRWKCRGCKKQFSVKVGTIFRDSRLGLDKWMVAMWMLANCRNGVSSYEIARAMASRKRARGTCFTASARL